MNSNSSLFQINFNTYYKNLKILFKNCYVIINKYKKIELLRGDMQHKGKKNHGMLKKIGNDTKFFRLMQ